MKKNEDLKPKGKILKPIECPQADCIIPDEIPFNKDPKRGKYYTKEQWEKFCKVRSAAIDPYSGVEEVNYKSLIKDYTATNIMEPYKPLGPTYKKIDKEGIDIYKIQLNNGSAMTLKIVDCPVNKTRKIYSLLREYNIGKTLASISENVVKPIAMKQITLDRGRIVRVEMLMEYGGVSLDNLELKMKKGLVMKIMEQLIEALALMASIGIVHLDIKPANTLWDEKTEKVKLIDFGTSVAFYRSPEVINMVAKEEQKSKIVGYTKFYASPEILNINKKGKEIVLNKVDVFCFGMTFAEILLACHGEGLLERDNPNINEHMKFIKDLKASLELHGESCWYDLLEKCLRFLPEERPTFAEIKDEFSKVASQLGFKNTIKSYAYSFKKDTYLALAESYMELKEYETALWYYKECMNNCTIIQEEKANIYQKLGEAYLNSNQEELAISYLKKMKEIYKKKKDVAGLIKNYKLLASSYYSLGNYGKRIHYITKAVKVGTKEYNGEDNETIISLYQILASIYNGLCDHTKAIEYITKAIGIAEKLHGKDHIALATLYNTLGNIYGDSKNCKEALNCYTKALKLNLAAYGENHIEVANSYESLMALYTRIPPGYTLIEDSVDEVYEKMFEYSYKAKCIRVALYGDTGRPLVYSYILLGVACKKLTNLGHDSKHKNAIAADLGRLYSSYQYDVASLDYYWKAVYINMMYYPDDDKSFSDLYTNLANGHESLGQYGKAIECYNKAIKIIISTYGEHHIELVDLYHSLGMMYMKEEYNEEAIKWYIRAIDVAVKVYGEGHELVGELNHELECLF